MLAQGVGHVAQDGVADGVSVLVVDLLEVVEVSDQEAHVLRLPGVPPLAV